MKPIHQVFVGIFTACLPALAAGDLPSGFQKAGLMQRLLAGRILHEEVVNSPREFRDVFRAYFNKVSARDYADLITNHAKWVDIMPEVTEAKTTHVNADHTVLDYWLHMVVTVAIFRQSIYPEGRHTVQLASDPTKESRIVNEITNYRQYVKSATESTRLIPYQGGLLIEDDVHVVLTKPSATSNFVKRELQKIFGRYLASFRAALQGDRP